MTQRILITGATGTIGQALVDVLRQRGIAFTAMTSRSAQRIADAPTVQGDFGDPASLRRAFEGFDTVFLLLPLTPQLPAHGKNAIEAALAAGVRHVVRISAAGADADSPFSLARVHGEIDRRLQDSGLGWTLLRPTFFMQNLINFHGEQVRAGTFHAAHGDGALAVVEVRDIAESAAVVLVDPGKHQGRIYTLTGGEALTNVQQMAAIAAATGREKRYVDIPENEAREALAAAGAPPLVVDWMSSLNGVVKAGYAAETTGDVAALTGHPPRRFADFVREHADAWR